VPILNCYLDKFQEQSLPVYASRDWHPPDHCSFTDQGGPWPVHCVQATEGAKFADTLALPESVKIISKAWLPDQETYSAFQKTNLNEKLKAGSIGRLFVGGLATDYCVLNSVKDAIQLGYTVFLLENAIRAVNVQPEDGRKAIEEMTRMGAHLCQTGDLRPALTHSNALLTDLYQLTMMQSYFDQKMDQIAVFEFFVRTLPPNRSFLIAAGLESVLEYLETLHFTENELDWLRRCGHLRRDFVDSLEGFRFTGDVHAMPEGTIFFGNEPILRITAPLPQAQLVETRIINLLQFQTLIASKAARMVLAAPGKQLIDFGLRRAHGAEAGLFAARASYLAGFSGTATVQAGALFGIPLYGTMAHSFIQAHDREDQAFEQFARSHPKNIILLLDTYDIDHAARRTVALGKKLIKKGIHILGVRLDSGNLTAHARSVRNILDEGGFPEIRILVSGNLDEYALATFAKEKAPVDGFGIGTRLSTSEDAPSLECAYKLQEYGGHPRRKRSEQKATWPGRKQVYRTINTEGVMQGDRVTLVDETEKGTPLIQPCTRENQRLAPPESLAKIRERVARQLQGLPEPLKSLQTEPTYPVKISPALEDLAETVDRRTNTPT
jgi:nicotinate phosphoribosyltransferase